MCILLEIGRYRPMCGIIVYYSRKVMAVFFLHIFTCGGAARSLISQILVLVVVLRKLKVSEAARVFIEAGRAPPIDPPGLYPHFADAIP